VSISSDIPLKRNFLINCAIIFLNSRGEEAPERDEVSSQRGRPKRRGGDVEARRVLKTPELTANCHFCEDTRAGVRYYTPRVRRARLLKKVGEAYAIKYGIGTPERGPPCEDTPYWRAGAGAGHLH
jgi:hypothetical protein